ncbi:MAG: hypothetical protein WBK91_01510 [Alphaproteobacteria bacterium]
MAEPLNDNDAARARIGHFISLVALELSARTMPDSGNAKYKARHLAIFPGGQQIADQADQSIQDLLLVKGVQRNAARSIFAAMLAKAAKDRAAWPEQDMPGRGMLPLHRKTKTRRKAKTLHLDTERIETAARKIINKTLTQFATRPADELRAFEAIIAPRP